MTRSNTGREKFIHLTLPSQSQVKRRKSGQGLKHKGILRLVQLAFSGSPGSPTQGIALPMAD